MAYTGFHAQFRARNHPQQKPRDDVDDRALPAAVFAKWHDKYKFTLDAAAARHNAKLPRFFSKRDNGLTKPWGGERVYCNPPYSNIRPWVEKAWKEHGCPLIVMLLPANRTEQAWWQELIETKRDKAGSPLRVRFLFGRLKFLTPEQKTIQPNNRPPFGCCLCVWDRSTP